MQKSQGGGKTSHRRHSKFEFCGSIMCFSSLKSFRHVIVTMPSTPLFNIRQTIPAPRTTNHGTMTSKGADQKGKGALEGFADAAEEAYRATKTTIATAYDDGKSKYKKFSAETANALHLTTTAEGSDTTGNVVPEVPDVRNITVPPTAVTTPKTANHPAALPVSPPNETTPLVGDQDGSSSGSDEKLQQKQSGVLGGTLGDGEMIASSNTRLLLFTPEILCRLTVIVAIGIIASVRNVDMIRSDGVVPLHLAIFWTTLGFLAGHMLQSVTHIVEGRDEVPRDNEVSAEDEKSDKSPLPQRSPLNKSISRVSFQDGQQSVASRPPTYVERKRDAIFRLFRGVSSYLVTPATSTICEAKQSQSMSTIAEIPGDIWTTLEDATRRTKAYWEEHVYDKPTGALMERLLQYDDFRTKKTLASTSTEMHASTEVDGTEDAYDARMKTERLGRLDTGNDRASVLQTKIEVDPLFKLRGMDVFRADGIPEERIWRQPILEENGLRDVPTFIVNLMLPGANLVVYFQMPSWIKKFEDIVEEDGDAEDTKAFKRFLRGTDQYRNKRWKILPCLVDGPYIIKVMAPAEKEVTIAGGRVGATWHKYDESVDHQSGKKRAALLEVDCDLISNPGVRKICNIVLGQVKNVRIDCAMIVEKPYLSEVKEPAACLGLWRMDKVDMDDSPLVPQKEEEQLLREMSVILNADDLAGLESEVEEEEAAME